ncbi:MAG: TetR/AcrR family transcriptional regulator, partial [Clostridiales bacterium]
MILPKYSPKEVLILESVIELFFGGAPLYSMKIADIAAEAGIGKGTVYEYFSSKEELLGKAIAYQILQEIKEISQEIVQAKDFKQCTFAILSRISHCKHSVSPPFMLLRPEFTEANEVKRIFKEMKKT